MHNEISGIKLQEFLKHQFYGFLNYGLRNLWLFTQKGCPRSWQREYQIDTFLSKNDIKYVYVHITKDGEVRIRWDMHGRFFVDLVNGLMTKIDRKSLKKLAETKDRNVKIEILLRMVRSIFDEPFYVHQFLDISYRRRIHRAMKTLVQLKLVEKTKTQKHGYQLTRTGLQIAEMLASSLRFWLYTERTWFSTIWQGVNRIATRD